MEGKYNSLPKVSHHGLSQTSHPSTVGLGGIAMDKAELPWPGLRDYFLRVSSCQSREDFMRTACLEVQTLIPFDTTANIFSITDLAHIGGIAPSDIAASFNSYYRFRFPPFFKDWHHSPEIMDWRPMDSSEFAVDFMWPNGCWKSLNHHPVPGQQIRLSIHRSRSSSNFLESDVDTLGLVDSYLNGIYSAFDKKGDTLNPKLSAEAIAERFPLLSRREAEVSSLIACRLNTAEIATNLFISRRTVEKHIESIFEKLDVRSREQLRWRLGVTPPIGLWRLQYGEESLPKIT